MIIDTSALLAMLFDEPLVAMDMVFWRPQAEAALAQVESQ
jgi:hypothetical protein